MSAADQGMPLRLETTEAARKVLDEWAASLAQVIESMTDQLPEVRWGPTPAPASDSEAGADLLWWEQPLAGPPGMTVWLMAPRPVWEHLGSLTLKVAGIETAELGESKNTFFEILGQSLSVMARGIGSALGVEVSCVDGKEGVAPTGLRDWATVSIQFPDQNLPAVLLGWSEGLLNLVATPPATPQETARKAPVEAPLPAAQEGPTHSAQHSRTMGLLLDVELPVSISFGKTWMPMKEVLKLTTGSIVELNRDVNDLVDVLVNHRLIARGEVVVVDGNYGVRIRKIADREDRLGAIP
ncbi:MAG: flagellar motor switch protein FliN [Bryobacteraceae bacterium]